MKLFRKKQTVQTAPDCPGNGGKRFSGFFGTVVSDVGCVRHNNEDHFSICGGSYFFLRDRLLYARSVVKNVSAQADRGGIGDV